MRRVVVDTNVLVSAILFGGTPGVVLRLAAAGGMLSFTSPVLLTELHGVLLSKFHLSPGIAELIVNEWKAASEVVEPAVEVSVITDDPSDNRVLECALSAHADAIISGDKHLLILTSFHGIPILSPQAFLALQR
ncbi:MAG: putative toxin-antitoxin system toxin component, PIN family [Omnitrophica bacterium RIFCSPHIGHO2_02_FULL_63_14]|nr:MAG: putative toxin-antitoxin system toxin component, PIN family [Omnitrophica bacterium RIFCSPHIGHO2_02_FULL_63_14]